MSDTVEMPKSRTCGPSSTSGSTNLTSVVIATRGERLALSRTRLSGRDQRPEAFHTEVLGIVEIDADNRIAARVMFDLDDIDAAFDELDARYLAGEAAAHARTWSVIANARAALVRHELPATTPDWVNLDHRRGVAFASGDMTAYIRAAWDLEQTFSTYIEAVHRLNSLGAVFTQIARGTSLEGFDAEWRVVEFMTVEGDLINRAEFFDEADLDAALARFDELSRPAPQLENAASRTYDRFNAYFAARDWDAMAAMLADDSLMDDRRRIVGAGVRRGRDATMAAWRAIAEIRVTNIDVGRHRDPRDPPRTLVVLGPGQAALRRSTWRHSRSSTSTPTSGWWRWSRSTSTTSIAALAELDARYLAGDAAAHAHTWSVIAGAYAAINRRELAATTPDYVNIDHRHGTTIAPGDLIAFIRASWDLDQESARHVETVHRLNNLGAVFTHRDMGRRKRASTPSGDASPF